MFVILSKMVKDIKVNISSVFSQSSRKKMCYYFVIVFVFVLFEVSLFKRGCVQITGRT